MAKKSSSPKKKTPPKKRTWFKRLFVAALVLAVAGAGYVLYLDRVVQEKFAGKRWSVPSRVYARALELYPQQPLTAADLSTELALAGYQSSVSGLEPGTFSQLGERFNITTRAFRHWDGEEPASSVRLQLHNGVLTELSDANSGAPLNLVRLKPVEIGIIHPAHREDRILVQLNQLPQVLPVALQVIEDRQFASHPGINIRSIARAALANLRAGKVVQGGSTLTQQLVKNFFLDSERSLTRKFNEAIMALLLELHFEKPDILEAYCNEIYLGQDGNRAIHGFGLAAHFYFNKPVEQLTLAESALLVAIVRGPAYYDPRRHPERTLARRDRVIETLLNDGVIDKAQATAALAEPLTVTAKPNRGNSRYPAFMALVKQQLTEYYREEDLRSEGLRIFTTLDPIVQIKAEQAVQAQVHRLQPNRAKLEAAAVVSRLGSAEVSAVVGSAEPRFWGYNRALEMRRPVGSLLKPAIYLTALAQPNRYTLATPVRDVAVSLPQPDGSVWSPDNYDHVSHGAIPLVLALANSYNQAAVNLGLDLGLQRVADTLQRLGIAGDIPPYPSVMLGALELSPLAVAQMYQTLADRGYYTPLRAVREVLDAQHRPLQRYALETDKRFDEAPVYLLNQALRVAFKEGTGRRAAEQLNRPLNLAGKTGTTNDLRDSWYAGFGSEYLAVIWLGNDENKVTGLTGASGALPAWASLMSGLEYGLEPLPPPAGIVEKEVDRESGLLADTGCEARFTLSFIAGSEPSESASCAKPRAVDVLQRLKGWFR